VCCRKLKNRVAAQTARDRKKQRMDELEVLLAQVEADNKRLQAENEALRRRTGKLSAENSQLKEKLGGVVDTAVVSESPESAVLNPQQQEQILTPLPSTTPSRLLQMMIMLR
jgi:predicted nuclease with TOPRIM domain